MKEVEMLYLRLVSVWDSTEKILATDSQYKSILSDRMQWPHFTDLIHKMMFFDCMTYLPDDIMVKVDRASMGASLEARAPFLDHRVVKFAWSLPMNMIVRAGKSKWIIRKILHKYVPAKLIERPKMGFGIPLDSWLRGPLREWAEGLLDFNQIEREGILNAGLIRSRWAEHLSGKRNWQYCIWNILMFEAWKNYWMKDNGC